MASHRNSALCHDEGRAALIAQPIHLREGLPPRSLVDIRLHAVIIRQNREHFRRSAVRIVFSKAAAHHVS